jgi:hypothetical protein
MSSRKWKDAKVLQGIAITGKIPPPAKFCNQQNLATGGAKAEPEKFGHQGKIWDGLKKKERCQGVARVCHLHNLAPRLKILKESW